MEFKQLNAIVTGGASGLGLAVTQRIIAAGGSVVILDLDCERSANELILLGERAHFIATDVTSESAVDEALLAAHSQLDQIQLVINCAGIAPSKRVLARDGLISNAEFQQVINVNLNGSFNVCRAAVNLMQHNNTIGKDDERGVIINTASIAAFEGQIGQAAYAASKGGIASMTLPLAREFARLGIRVMAIAPGLFETPMFEGLPLAAREALAANTPYPPRLGQPDEFASLVQHIVENPMLNGSTIRLDGALRMGQK
jgi:3-hydroxyacyl-CoA dehydrogenase/3-hydroxy-2-methylbutyryl-CoA dehydrogenase